MSIFNRNDRFVNRHLGVSREEIKEMLKIVGADSVDALIDESIPRGIRLKDDIKIDPALTEYEYLRELRSKAEKNKPFRHFIGQGYYNTITPSVILRNIFQNPGWYTPYTPYQAEIAQGRLEALLNFQTMVSELTGFPMANASLLDEGTAAAEAMAMLFDQKNKRNKENPVSKIFVDQNVFDQTIDVLRTRAMPLDIEVEVGDWQSMNIDGSQYFAVLIQYPDDRGNIHDYSSFSEKLKGEDIYLIAAADILALTLLATPASWGADVAIGTTQRFGVPMGFGGPHAAYFATTEKFKRQIPGRIIGVSVDRHGDSALRMALQTREQHIRREKATS
ncbi:MAG: glycine dehydrogenase (aminomethyl-transferring), partial [Saprospiraceae bacterium]|nr:glycine dehydrogenase (aminomethyl-transferring) [Saprospiraceae bacterium]